MELNREKIKIHTAGKYNEINRIGIIELDLTDQETSQMIEELIVAKRNKSSLRIGIYDKTECKECKREYIKRETMRRIITCKECKKKVIVVEEDGKPYIVCECHFLELDNLNQSFPEDWNF